ncbi:hypothetical protein FF1_036540 [Malus domestica]
MTPNAIPPLVVRQSRQNSSNQRSSNKTTTFDFKLNDTISNDPSAIRSTHNKPLKTHNFSLKGNGPNRNNAKNDTVIPSAHQNSIKDIILKAFHPNGTPKKQKQPPKNTAEIQCIN